jgi:osmotically-inducible protein OsmY
MMRLLLLLAVALSLGACASAISSGYGEGGRDASGRSYAEARADNQISAAVTSALVRERGVPAMDIEVRTLQGVVTLQGRVASEAISRRAERIAAATSGVRRVVNQLLIEP